jgi:two-component system, chemotaxis family, sensor kinase CheA
MNHKDGESTMRRFIDYVVLPKEISTFEASYLRRMNRIALAFFALHIPVMFAIAWGNGTRPWLAALLTTATVVGPALAYKTLSNPRAVSTTYGVAAMFMGGLLVHFGQGPMQIEMHFYFFALIAMLAIFGNPLVILAAALTVALHHLALWFVLPSSVFNYDAPVWVVAVHALFVVLESVAACFIARSFFDNVIGLAKIVQARTAELDNRNREMRLVLDNVAQGFATIDRDGIPAVECSTVFERWFSASKEHESLFDRFGKKAPAFAERSRAGWSEVVDGVMPLALTLAQMPKELLVDGVHYRVGYVPIGTDETPERFLVVVTDVTADVHRERSECQRREEMQLFERLLSNRNMVNSFLDEASALVTAIASGQTTDVIVFQRVLHTLKGNSAIFGLDSLASLCHDLEQYVVEEGTPPPEAELAKLRERWDALAADIDRLVGTRHRVIEISESQHAALEQAVRRGAHGPSLLAMVHSLKLEPTERRLDHFSEQARRIAARLHKSVDVRVESQELRLDPEHWRPFWGTFVHAVRNAVDHGLEPGDERVSRGKLEHGTVTLRTYLRSDRFVVEIGDDGRGMDWQALARKARELGIPAGTQDEVKQALFHKGISTAVQVTDLSGRGIGMGALHTATESLGGDLEIETMEGRGTTLRMSFPKSAMWPGLVTMAPSRPAIAAVGA